MVLATLPSTRSRLARKSSDEQLVITRSPANKYEGWWVTGQAKAQLPRMTQASTWQGGTQHTDHRRERGDVHALSCHPLPLPFHTRFGPTLWG